MITRERKIIFIDLLQRYPIKEEVQIIDSIQFTIQHHGIGWDFNTAEAVMRTYDGYADGFSLGGIVKYLGWDESSRIHHPGYLRLIRTAIRTPVYVADDLRNFFSEWTLKRVLQEQPQIFAKKKVLFQCVTATAIMPKIAKSGARLFAADPLLISEAPVILKGLFQINLFYRTLKPLASPILFNLIKPLTHKKKDRTAKLLEKWMSECDILVGFGNILPTLESYQHLAGKIILVDSLDPITQNKLEAAGIEQIIEFVPKINPGGNSTVHQFSILEAIIDQSRLLHSSTLSLQDYFLKWLEKSNLSPQIHAHSLSATRNLRKRCAFIIHALTQEDLWKISWARPFKGARAPIKNFLEKGMSYSPCFYMGQLTGVVSEATGQVVDCDFYGLPATPKHILKMDEEFLYKRLIQCVELAKSRGASIVGLGAYTKVAGDAGVSVARRSTIPVTNGNSYSASTALWAARQMVKKLDLIPKERIGNRFRAKAMIIGATGSIGRVSALLISLVFQEIVLIANRPDKLLELRDEVLKLSPDIQVRVATQADSEIMDVDLIIAATSNQNQTPILNIEWVKPGAVICDCSRPMDISRDQALKRPDILVIESGEVDLPGHPRINVDLGLPFPSVYACTAETVLLTLEGRYESFSLSKHLSLAKTKEIYKIGVKHGARLSAIQGPNGLVTEEQIQRCRALAIERLKTWDFGSIRAGRSYPKSPSYEIIKPRALNFETKESLFKSEFTSDLSQ